MTPPLFRSLNILLTFATVAYSHMQLNYPAPFNASNNPHLTTAPDPYLQYPYDCCGVNDRWLYPCRGYHTLVGTPAGAPTATWAAGSTQNWSISGIGNHWGGSCQVGFSTDGGESFHVATSYEGNCPHRNGGEDASGQQFEVNVPEDLSSGTVVFAWIWYNREQELNMNCAAVEITAARGDGLTSRRDRSQARGGGAWFGSWKTGSERIGDQIKTRRSSPEVAFEDRPLMLVADNGNGCMTPKTTAEVKFPDPGPDVVQGDGVYPLALPTGNCNASVMLLKQAYDGEYGNDGH